VLRRRSAGTSILGALAHRGTCASQRAKPRTSDLVPQGFESLSTAVQQVLAPVRPSAAYRQALARDLMALARQKQSPGIILQRPAGHRRGILIGAAVSSAVSVAGLVALLWHHRARQAVPHASQAS
jgi:hypothetical protein